MKGIRSAIGQLCGYHRRTRSGHRLGAALAAGLMALLIACATPSQLDSSPRATAQPIATARGPVSDTIGHALLASVTDEPNAVAQRQFAALVDSVRRSLTSPLVAGNKVVTLVDGPATYAAIDAAIATAQRHIHVETYIFADDELGRQFVARLLKKAREGVEVRVIYDAVGSLTTPENLFAELRAAGGEVVKFRPLNPVKTRFWKFHNRDHRKIIVVDGRIAFTGGLNISSAYSSSSAAKPGPETGLTEGWRDTHVLITGPAAEQFQSLFLDAWSDIKGIPPLPRDGYFPDIPAKGDQFVSAVASKGDNQADESIYKTYLAAIRNASTRIWITQAYFSPPAELRDALLSAVRRGVDVRVIVPGFTDSKLIWYAARNEYEPLLRGGVRIFEAQDALLHAKTALIDNSLSIIGSANLDYRSFLHNNEVTAVVVGSPTSDRMAAIFKTDLEASHELKLAEWENRSFSQRTKENLSSLLKFWL